jgi:DNA-binding transcriptional LysR family regulator
MMPTKNVPLSRLDWDHLRVFLTVARTRSLAVAARKLLMDNSTVSRRVAQLETTVGATLFTRNRMGMDVNELGEALLPHVQKMELGSLELKETLAGSKTPRGLVRLAGMEGITSLYLAPRMHAFEKQCPNIAIELVTSTEVVNVVRRDADIFLAYFEPTGTGVVSERIGEFSLVLCAGRRYIESQGRPESIDDLGRHKFIGYIHDLVQVGALRWLDELIADPDIRFRSNSMVAQMNAAVAGAGLVLLPRYCLQYESDLIPLLEDDIDIRRPVWASVHRDMMYFPRIKAVMSFLQRTLSDERATLARPPAVSPACHLPTDLNRVERSENPLAEAAPGHIDNRFPP